MNKKIISLMILLTIAIVNINFAFAAGNIGDNNPIVIRGNNLIINAQHNFSSAGTKYHVLGYKFVFTINNKTYTGYIADNSGLTGSGLQNVAIPVPFIGDSNSIMGILLSKYTSQQDHDNLENYLTVGGNLLMDGVITIKENGVLKGSVDSEGNKISGEVYDTYTGIVNARNWSTNSQIALKSHFNLPLHVPRIATPPTANISKDGTIVNGTTVQYNLGDTVNLSGALSVFPSFANKRYYSWDYKPKSSSYWTNIVSNQLNATNPTFPSLNKGQYDVRLKVYYDIFESMASTATASVIIDDAVFIDTAVTVDPDRKVTQAEVDSNKEIDVKITVKATLKNFKNVSQIKKWTIFCRKEPAGSNDQLQTYIQTSDLSLTAQNTFIMTVKAGELKSKDSFTQEYAIRAVCTLSNNIEGELLKVAHTIYKKDPPPPMPSNKPPVADIRAKAIVMAGDDVTFDGSHSYDPDGSIVSYAWNIPNSNGYISGDEGTVWFNSEGTYSISLTVTDNEGATDTERVTIHVMPPKPSAIITYIGKLKENRKISLDSSTSISPKHYPIDDALTKWEITPVSGCIVDDVKYKDSLLGVRNKDILIKKVGQIKVVLTLTNTAGYSGIATRYFDIAIDEAPIADYSGPEIILRDQVDENGKSYGIIPVTCTSYSPDGDIIGGRKWSYRYDSNNDGDFNDEAEVVLSDENKLTESIKSYDVGSYRVRLIVTEHIPEEDTILEFLNPEDIKSTMVKNW